MTVPAVLRKPDLRRAAEVSKETGCAIEIRFGDAVVTIYPAGKEDDDRKGIDFSRPVL